MYKGHLTWKRILGGLYVEGWAGQGKVMGEEGAQLLLNNNKNFF